LLRACLLRPLLSNGCCIAAYFGRCLATSLHATIRLWFISIQNVTCLPTWKLTYISCDRTLLVWHYTEDLQHKFSIYLDRIHFPMYYLYEIKCNLPFRYIYLLYCLIELCVTATPTCFSLTWPSLGGIYFRRKLYNSYV
jgi:hypothetical protein